MTQVVVAKLILPASLVFCGILLALIRFLSNVRMRENSLGVGHEVLKRYQYAIYALLCIFILAVVSSLSALFYLLGQKDLFPLMLILFKLAVIGTVIGAIIAVIITRHR